MSIPREILNKIKKRYDDIPMPIMVMSGIEPVYLNKTLSNTAGFRIEALNVEAGYGDYKKVSISKENLSGLLKFIDSYDNAKDTIDIYMVLFDEELDSMVEYSKKYNSQKKFFQDVLDCIYDQIYVIDNTGKVLMINDAVLKKNYHREGIVGKTMNELIEIGFSDGALCYDVIESRSAKGKIFKEAEEYELLAWGVPHFDDNNEVDFLVTTEWDLENLIYLKSLLTSGKATVPKEIYPELEYYRNKLSVTDDIIGNSPKIKELLQMAGKLSRSDSTILIYGESGTGKELLTKYIYNNSPRANGPLIEVNCGAIPENLFESELFGYDKGAFTDADSRGKKGLFEAANKGTLLLDEVGEIPLGAQTKLLRALQEKEIHRVGGNACLPIDVRVIGATNTDLKKAVEKRQFREDLFYRLNVLPLYVPPLRERVEDIPDLISYFISQFNAKYKTAKEYNQSDLDILCNYMWPGNVRELRNIIERALLISNNDVIPRAIWANLLMQSGTSNNDNDVETSISLKDKIEEFERQLLQQHLSLYENSRQFAELMGTDKSTINRKLKKYGLRHQ